MKKQAETPLVARSSIADQWVPIFAAWCDLGSQHPQLGLSESRFACSRFCVHHGERLQAVGALVKRGHRWLAHREKFADAAVSLLLGLEVAA